MGEANDKVDSQSGKQGNPFIFLQCSPGSYKWCSPPSRAEVQNETPPCSRKPVQPDDGCKQNDIFCRVGE